MSCILCLETTATTYIDVDSTEGQQLEAKSKIEEHLPWLKEIWHKEKTQIICQKCWLALLSFHQFCMQVKRAHNLLNDVISPEELKVKGTTTNFVHPPTNVIRKRGRPRRKKPTEVMLAEYDLIDLAHKLLDTEEVKVEVNDLREVKIDMDNDEKNATSCKRRRSRRNMFVVEALAECNLTEVPVEELLMPDIKEEVMETDPVEINTCANGDKLCSSPELGANNSYNDSSDNESCSEQRTISKHKKRQHSKLTQQYDDFIAAANFKLTCSVCSAETLDFSALLEHFRKVHKTRGYMRCCGKKLLKRGVLVDHIHTHINPSYFQCKLCDKVMSDRRCLELHMKFSHEDKRERIHRCEICSKSYYRQSVLMRHVQSHVPEEQKTFACPQCDKTFATNYIMKQHLRLVHLNLYAKICDVCGKSIQGREAFRRHQEEHLGVPRNSVHCDLCGLTLTNKYGLARHIKVRHTEENQRPAKCTICSKVSSSLTALKRHMEYMHSMERKHACQLCEKAFKRAADLKEHMTTHTGEHLYTCPHCPKTFKSNANMHSHRKKAHRKEWEEKRQQRYSAGHLSSDTNIATAMLKSAN